jgi:hypothetical protein
MSPIILVQIGPIIAAKVAFKVIKINKVVSLAVVASGGNTYGIKASGSQVIACKNTPQIIHDFLLLYNSSRKVTKSCENDAISAGRVARIEINVFPAFSAIAKGEIKLVVNPSIIENKDPS